MVSRARAPRPQRVRGERFGVMLPRAGVPARVDDFGGPLKVPSFLPGSVLEAVNPRQRRVL
eukprot:63358-Lingulodinium_polyedra.AAC.1